MKRLVLLKYLLFFTFFYVFNIMCIIENIPTKPLSSSFLSPFSSFFIKYDQEGFYGNTLVQTLYGYKPIKKLVRGDVVIDCKGEEKRIIAVTKKYVDQYVKLIVDNTIIYSGCDQYYYAFSVPLWFSAKKVWAGAMLCNNKNESCEVMHAELIYEKALLYCLTVEDHTFSIAPNGLCTHNAEVLIICASSMCLGQVIIINPITAIIGAAIALSIVAHEAYQVYIQQCPNNAQSIALPTDVILAERSYFTQRVTALETIKQEFLYIKNDLENIKAFCNVNSASFTYQFLKQTNTQNIHNQNQLLKISVASETQLSDSQKENLRALREIELKHLEQEVGVIQVALALHVNELIEQVYGADNEYQRAKKEIDIVTALWNNNCDRMTDVIALQSYEADLLDEHLLNDFNQKIDELKIVAHYYRNCMNTMCVKQSTNIIELLEKMNYAITEYDQRITKEKNRVDQKIFISEQYFEQRGIFIGHVKNEIKNCFAKSRNDRNAQVIAEAKNKLLNIIVSGGPNQNNKKNDDDDKECAVDKKFTPEELTKIAKDMGFEKTNYRSNGQPVFKKGNRYISPDVDSHSGGIWKMADSVKNLGRKATRMGTYDASLNLIGK